MPQINEFSWMESFLKILLLFFSTSFVFAWMLSQKFNSYRSFSLLFLSF